MVDPYEEFDRLVNSVTSVTRWVLLEYSVSPWTLSEMFDGLSAEIASYVIRELSTLDVLVWHNSLPELAL